MTGLGHTGMVRRIKALRSVQPAGRLVPLNGSWECTMELRRRKFLHLAAGAAALPAVSCIQRARAQDYPAKPVRIITHSAPGGAADALLRIVADRLSQSWGHQVVVLNYPGAGGAGRRRIGTTSPSSTSYLTLPASVRSAI